MTVIKADRVSNLSPLYTKVKQVFPSVVCMMVYIQCNGGAAFITTWKLADLNFFLSYKVIK